MKSLSKIANLRWLVPVFLSSLIFINMGCSGSPSQALPTGVDMPSGGATAGPAQGAQPGTPEVTGDQGEADLFAVVSDTTGLSRQHPYPREYYVETPYWDLQILSIFRGDEAMQMLVGISPDAPLPPEGKEYLLVKVWLQSKILEEGYRDIGLDELFITGDHFKIYKDTLWGWPTPEFFYNDIFAAQAVEGWIDTLVDKDESNLMLAMDMTDTVGGESQPRVVRYIAIDGDASIPIPGEIMSLTPNEVGKTIEQPAQKGEIVITENWELTLVDALVGQAVLEMLTKMSEDNSPPEPGMQYVGIHMKARLISKVDQPGVISDNDFSVCGTDCMDNYRSQIIYQDQPITIQKFVDLVLPGGVVEGWFFVPVPAGQISLMLKYYSPSDSRYFQIHP